MSQDMQPYNGKTAALEIAEQTIPEALNAALIENDFSKLTPDNRAAYYKSYCESLGLNWLTRPLDVLKAQDGTHKLYPNKTAADQLARLHAITFETLYRETMEGLYIVGMKGTLPNGRTLDDEGVVPIKGLQAKDLANARKKTITQARRRVTLALAGLGWANGDDAGEPVTFDATLGRLPEIDAVDAPTDAENEQNIIDLFGGVTTSSAIDDPPGEVHLEPKPKPEPITPAIPAWTGADREELEPRLDALLGQGMHMPGIWEIWHVDYPEIRTLYEMPADYVRAFLDDFDKPATAAVEE